MSSSFWSKCKTNINTKLINKATKVELKATPRLWDMPEISPAKALSAFDNACPIPLTVPTNPKDGIAHIKYLSIVFSLSNFKAKYTLDAESTWVVSNALENVVELVEEAVSKTSTRSVDVSPLASLI